jgi:nucleoside-diphosphate-sugar epimerase
MASSRHVLLLGGHGKIAQLLTPLLLQRSWTVTSVIRTQDQAPTIEKLGAGKPGRLNVLVRSLEDITSQDIAAGILNEVKPDYVAWSAGAGGKGGAEMTFKIDRDVAINFIRASAANPAVQRFLLVSYTGSRRRNAPWWPAKEWDDYCEKVNNGALANYYKAKIAADEALYEASRASSSLVGICLRPATLTAEPSSGVTLGAEGIPVMGQVSREAVAQTADALLAAEGVKNCWLDLVDGSDNAEKAVEKAVKEGVNSAKGEPMHES